MLLGRLQTVNKKGSNTELVETAIAKQILVNRMKYSGSKETI